MQQSPLTTTRKKIIYLVAAIAVLCAGGTGWHFIAGAKAKSPAAAAPAPVPVTAQTVQRAAFPVFVSGLGTVQPYNTVSVKSRVDGQIVNVAVKQGQLVKQGDLLVQIDPRPFQAALEQAQAKKAQDEANLRNAEVNLQRDMTLAKSEFASHQQVDNDQATANQLKAQVQGDQAAIDSAQVQLDYTTIRAPIPGKVGFRNVDPGNIVHASDTTGIMTIVKLQPISVVFTAPEEDIGAINNALGAGAVPVDALTSDDSRTLARGRLALVNNQIDAASGTFQMKATFANADNALWPGLSVNTRLLLETLPNAIVVPNGAVQHGPNGLYAYVIGKDNKVSMRDIKIGQEGGTSSVVASGLSPGERVVVSGQFRLVQGALVDAHPAPPAGKPEQEASNDNKQEP